MIYFFDSSGIAKLYIEETGSEWVQEIFDTTPIQYLWISRIAGPEVTSALTRRFRSGDLDEEDYHDCLDEFKYNYEMNIMKSGINNQKELLKGKCGICDYLEVCGGCRQKFGC